MHSIFFEWGVRFISFSKTGQADPYYTGVIPPPPDVRKKTPLESES